MRVEEYLAWGRTDTLIGFVGKGRLYLHIWTSKKMEELEGEGGPVPARAPVSQRLGYWTEFDQASKSCTGKIPYYYVYFGRVQQESFRQIGSCHLTTVTGVQP